MMNYAPGGKKNEVGICLKSGQFNALKELTPDYIELNFAEIMQMPENRFRELLAQICARGICSPSMTQLLPKWARVVDAWNTFDFYRDDLRRGFERAVQMGAEIVVFGNAGARNVDNNTPIELALQRLASFLRSAAELAKDFNISLCVEPLNRIQSNLINSMSEAGELLSCVDLANVGIVWDYFHFQVEKDDWDTVQENWHHIMHCHTAALLRRGIPDSGSQDRFLRTLKEHHYAGRLSFEFDQLPPDTDALNRAMEDYRRVLNNEQSEQAELSGGLSG